MVLFHTSVSILGGIITVLIVYFLYRKKGPVVWAWLASFLPDIPVFWLVPLGVTNIGIVLLITHTIGIFIFAALLALLDILLIELSWTRYFPPFPKVMKIIKKIGSWTETLERYHAVPRPIRVKRVFLVGLLAGAVHLAINLLIGVL